jgi:predicted phosphodiesterase
LTKSKRQKQSASQKVLWLLSVIIVGSMVVSLVIVALPSPPAPTPLPEPTWTAVPLPTESPTAQPAWPSSEPSPSFTPPATAQPTEPVIGPALPTDTPAAKPSFTVTPTATLVPTTTLTPRAETDSEFVFAVVGDSRGNPRVFGRVLAAAMADGSEFLVHTGDLVNQGDEVQWQEFEQIMAGFSLPFYPVPGNHDGLDGKLDGYLTHSGAPASHYSFDWGLAHLAFADSHNGGMGAEEMAWLRGDLSTTDQPLKVVIVHHPPFDPDGTDHVMAYGNEPFMALMAEQHVDHVFAGHIHAYAQGERDGVIYTITGGGGAPLYRQGHPQAYYHYLRVTVRGEEVLIEVVRI